jgi:hypothetical protein
MADEDRIFTEPRRRVVQATQTAMRAASDLDDLAAYCEDSRHAALTQVSAETMATTADSACRAAEGIRLVLIRYGFAKRTGMTGTGMSIEGFPPQPRGG